MCAQLVQKGSVEAAAVANEARRRSKLAARASRSTKGGAVSSVLRRLRSRGSVAGVGAPSPAGGELSNNLSDLSIDTPDQVKHATNNPGGRAEQSHIIDLSRAVVDTQRSYADESDDLESGCSSPSSGTDSSSNLSYLTAHSASSTSGTPRSGSGSHSSTPRGYANDPMPASTGKPLSRLSQHI